MKKLFTLSVSIAVTILFTQCKPQNTGDILQNAETRGKIISTLMSDENYSKELMDSMRNDNHKARMMNVHHEMMGKMMSDTSMHGMMMDKMMSKCQSDSGMCKKMIGKTMKMCGNDESKCDMMSEMMCCNKDMMKSMMKKMNKKGMIDKSCMEKGMMSMKEGSEKNQEK